MCSENTERLPQTNTARPTGLSVLCVLTFINSGFSALSYLFVGLSFNNLKHLVFETDAYESYFSMFPSMRTSMELLFAQPRWFYFVTGLLFIGSLFGAAWMWKLKRKGFHIYTIAQCLLILLSMLVMPGQGIPYTAIFWTALFVLLYGLYIKRMNR